MIFFIAFFAGSTFALNRADYPAPLQVPAVNPQWTSIIEARMGVGAPVIDKCNGRNQWAFTFDDGPAAATAIVLDALVRINVCYVRMPKYLLMQLYRLLVAKKRLSLCLEPRS